jgi:pentatricopeptide repeat protein
MTRLTFILPFLLLSAVALKAQDQPNTFADSLKRNLAEAVTAEQKVKWMGELSEFYMGIDKALSDDYAQNQLRAAEESRNRGLLVLAHLYNAKRYFSFSAQQANINTGIKSSEQALELARENNLEALQAWSYNSLANGYRLNSQYDKALNCHNLALSIASGIDNDSLMVNTYNTLAKTYLAKKEKMLAFRNFLQALNIAESSENFHLLRPCYLNMSFFYVDLEEYEKAKDFQYKFIAETYKHNQKFDRIEAYNTLGKIYARNKQYELAQSFYDRALALADTVNFKEIKLNTYSAMINMYFGTKQYEKALAFFDSKSELKSFIVQAGFSHFIDQVYGMSYTMMGNLDSGYYYLKRAEPVFEKSATRQNLYWFYGNMATLYRMKKNYTKALEYGLKAEAIGVSVGDMALKKQSAGELDSLYQEAGDFKKAYYYNHQFHAYKDSLDQLSQEKDLLSLEVENERKRKEREALVEAEAKRDRHNIQYMGITVAIAAVFIVLVMLGIFSVSRSTIRIIGFFAFIFLFEFIILIADNHIHHWTHGEPWKILAIKIGLISILLPLHHYLEEKVIHYLTTRKLLEINKDAFFSKFRSRKQSEEA